MIGRDGEMNRGLVWWTTSAKIKRKGIAMMQYWMLLLLLGGLTAGAEQATKDVLLAYYYPWYQKGDWSRHGYVGTPELGKYGTDDPDAAATHIDWAADYGIDGFFVSWWGKDSQTDQHLRAGLLKAKNLNRIKFAVYYEAFGILDPLDGKRDSIIDFSNPKVLDGMIADFTVLKNAFFSNPSYFRVDDKPVVGLYVTRQFRNWKVAHRETLEKKLGMTLYLIADEPFIVGGQRSPKTAQNTVGFDAYSPYNMFEPVNVRDGEAALDFLKREAMPVYKEWAEQTTFLPCFLPSYKDFRGNKVLTGTPEGLHETIRLMKSLPHKTIGKNVDRIFLLTSFNEWWEGTTVEPAKEYGTKYLEILRQEFGD